MIHTAAGLAHIQDYRSEFDSRWPLDEIWTSPWPTLEAIELLPGSPLSLDIWTLPPNWAASGPRQNIGQRTVDFTKALPPDWNRNSEISEAVIRRLKRLAVLLFTQTLRLQEQVRKPPLPSTWVVMMQLTCRVASDALQLPTVANHQTLCPDAHPIFANLTPDQTRSLAEKHATFFAGSTPRLNALYRHGHFDDWPARDVSVNEKQKVKRRWQPFSDEFTALVGHASLWVIEVLGPDLLECWTVLRHMRGQRISTSHPRKGRRLRSNFLSNWEGKVLKADLPFEYHFRVVASDGDKTHSFILTSWADLQPMMVESLASILQEAHAAVINLACGPRNGELTSLPRDCLREVMNGTLLRGYTFKLAEDQEVRDWPLPAVAVFAIRQQQRLAEVLDPGGTKLFASFGRSSKRVNERDRYQIPAHKFTDAVFTRDGRPLTSQCDGNVHSHRYRKTVARLAALSLVGANQILFDILGHRDPEMTLNYILSDPELQSEMRKIAREAALVMAKEAVHGANENGGPAAPGVRELAARFGARSAEKELDESSLQVVAEILSQNGRVMMVKKNTLCTKTLNQAGPCNKSIGNPDIGNCQIDCVHRLELAAARHDHRIAIGQALDEFENSEGMMRVWWQGQMVAHLLPFPDLTAELLMDPRLGAALKDVKLDALTSLTPSQRTAALTLLEKTA